MKRSEFLSQLKQALEHNLSAEDLKKNVDYYDAYIRDEVKNGRSEEDVIAELGDPWAIAKTIRISAEMGNSEYTDTVAEAEQSEQTQKEKPRSTGVFLVVAIILIVLAVFSMAFGLLAFVIRYAFPILLILFIIRLFSKR